MTATDGFYEALSGDYDRFVDWKARLAFEMPFLEDVFARHEVRRLVDLACGTGQHAIAFARLGVQVAAADMSEAMVRRARVSVASAGVPVKVHQLAFGELCRGLPGADARRHDAVTCLGNSLPHILDERALEAAISDIASVLRPGGALVIQNRNFDRVLARGDRYMSPEGHRTRAASGDEEWLFVRFYDFCGHNLTFNMLRLHRRGTEAWSMGRESTPLRAWCQAELVEHLQRGGFAQIASYGSFRGAPFEPLESPDLVLVAARAE